MLKQRSDEQLSKWDALVKSDIPGFNQLVQQQQVPAIILNNANDTPGGTTRPDQAESETDR
jgi:hypothetical protein